MTQDEHWMAKYNEVKEFIEANKRNPSKHDDTERECKDGAYEALGEEDVWVG